MLKEYTKELTGKGLLEEHGSSLRTTEKGRAFLKYYERIKEILAESGLPPDPCSLYVAAGKKLLSLGVSEKFVSKVRLSDDQATDLIKGILYLKERLQELSDGN